MMSYILLFSVITVSLADSLSGEEILQKVEQALKVEKQYLQASLIVQKKKRKKEYSLSIYTMEDNVAVEFHAPLRDKGTKYLRKETALWMYLPSIERTQKIAGHMLYQGVMGSDISYEELLKPTYWSKQYTPQRRDDSTEFGCDCLRLTLTASSSNAMYARRELWIEKTHYIPIKEHLYDSSGMMQKEWIRSDIKKTTNHWRAHTIEVQNTLHSESKTKIILKKIDENPNLSEDFFLHRWLER